MLSFSRSFSFFLSLSYVYISVSLSPSILLCDEDILYSKQRKAVNKRNAAHNKYSTQKLYGENNQRWENIPEAHRCNKSEWNETISFQCSRWHTTYLRQIWLSKDVTETFSDAFFLVQLINIIYYAQYASWLSPDVCFLLQCIAKILLNKIKRSISMKNVCVFFARPSRH